MAGLENLGNEMDKVSEMINNLLELLQNLNNLVELLQDHLGKIVEETDPEKQKILVAELQQEVEKLSR